MNAQEMKSWTPNRVSLFSGHMIDAPGREKPRFPPSKETIAAEAIASKLDQLNAGSDDLCICGGACGGDILFAEATLARGASLELYLPFDEETFLAKSVDFAGGNWRARFLAIKARATLHLLPPERHASPGVDPDEKTNLCMLEAAERFGSGKVDFICLWNGQQGDGPGGTRHLMEQVSASGGRVHWLDTTRLWDCG